MQSICLRSFKASILAYGSIIQPHFCALLDHPEKPTLWGMPRANRYIVAGSVYHLTHRCHNRQFLLKFATDRNGYRRRLREAIRQTGLSLLTYNLTSSTECRPTQKKRESDCPHGRKCRGWAFPHSDSPKRRFELARFGIAHLSIGQFEQSESAVDRRLPRSQGCSGEKSGSEFVLRNRRQAFYCHRLFRLRSGLGDS